MDNIVDELINIELKANAVLDKLAGDKAALSKRINEEIARRKAEIDRETEKTIADLRQAALTETEEKVEQIALDSQRGMSMVEAAFDKYREQWRAVIFQHITER